MGESKKKLILIDSNAIMHRAYHALPPLSTKKGELVNAVYGFTSTLLSVIENFKPDYIAASFDLAGPTFRHEEYKDYKATRTKAPDEFYQQIPRVKELVENFNIPIYEKQGYEADDIIGTLSVQAEKNENLEILIVTGDLDTLQLVTPKTNVYTMRRGLSDSVLYDKEKVLERYGLLPSQIIDLKGLRGDPSDNIPGVKGIGEKTATELLKKYGNIENVYQNIEEIKGSVKDKLEKDRLKAFMSKKLATISVDVPVKLELERTEVHDFDREKLVNFLKELNFYSLIKRIPEQNKEIYPAERRETFPLETEVGGVRDFKYEEVSRENFDEFWREIKKQTEIAITLDCSGKFSGTKIYGITFSWTTGRSHYLKFEESAFEKIKEILEDEKIKKIGYDLKSIYESLCFSGINLRGIYFDNMIAAYLIDPGSKIELEKIIMIELGEEVEFSKEKKGQMEFLVDEEERKRDIREFCQKADYSFKLKKILLQIGRAHV